MISNHRNDKMSLSHRILRHGSAPCMSCKQQTVSFTSVKGLALMHIEFLMLHRFPTCVITRHVPHVRLLGYLFPDITFYVYQSPVWETDENNIKRITAEFDATKKQKTPFSLIFTMEKDAQQMCGTIRANATAALFSLPTPPTDHMHGLLFLPLYAVDGCVHLFLHYTSTTPTAQEFNEKLLREEMSAFSARPASYDIQVEKEILTAAVRARLICQGNVVNDEIVEAVMESLSKLVAGEILAIAGNMFQ